MAQQVQNPEEFETDPVVWRIWQTVRERADLPTSLAENTPPREEPPPMNQTGLYEFLLSLTWRTPAPFPPTQPGSRCSWPLLQHRGHGPGGVR